jgi:hypothetical protein
MRHGCPGPTERSVRLSHHYRLTDSTVTNSGRRGRALWHEGPTSANAASDYSGDASWRMSGQKLGNPENVGLELLVILEG